MKFIYNCGLRINNGSQNGKTKRVYEKLFRFALVKTDPWLYRL